MQTRSTTRQPPMALPEHNVFAERAAAWGTTMRKTGLFLQSRMKLETPMGILQPPHKCTVCGVLMPDSNNMWNVAGFRFTGADVHMAIEHACLEKPREKELDAVYDLFAEDIDAMVEKCVV